MQPATMKLSDDLISVAVQATEHRSEAVAALVGAAAAILVEDFGTPATIEMLKASLHDAAEIWRRRAMN